MFTKGSKAKREHALTIQNGAKWCGGWWWLWGRMGFQTMGRGRPLSRSCSVWLSWSGWLPQFSQPESFSSSDCGALPVDAMVGLLDMNCNTVLRVSSFHRLSMFTQSDFQCPLSFSHIHFWALLTGNFMHHSCLFLLWGPVLHLH